MIRQAINENGLVDVVAIEHHPHSPHAALLTSDVYVSSSRWEGWSLAICEALRFGLPVVATDCEFGPSDILVDERLGRLVPFDDGALARAMLHYCDHLSSERAHAQYRRDYIDQFSVENVVHAHAAALKLAARNRQSICDQD
jgi:glycosyltransferase involved in cell wall biosynthesis